MKLWSCKRVLLLLASFLLSANVYAASLNEKAPNAPTNQRQRLIKVNSLKELPEEIVYLLNKEVGEVADIREDFNQSDMITDLYELRQGLREAALGKDLAVLIIARGGIALSFIELTFCKGDKG